LTETLQERVRKEDKTRWLEGTWRDGWMHARMILIVSICFVVCCSALYGMTTLSGSVHAADILENSVGDVRSTAHDTPLSIVVSSPKNVTYTGSNIRLNFTVQGSVSWIGYSVDGLANVTILANTTLVNLKEGSHNVTVYINDTDGIMYSSPTVYFTTLASPLQETPFSTLFLIALAVLISFLTSLTNRLLTNPEKSRAWRREISDWNKEFQEARREGDKKKLEKVTKRQKEILQLQSKMMWQSMKVTLIFFVPLIIIWSILGGFYTIAGQPITVAYLPGVGPVLHIVIFSFSSLIWWYLLCSMLFGTLFSHVFGIVEVSD